ncbi:uroporphyrinogen-III C-methyltransferase [Epibacterium ulvae]|uniref:uroporphyrinogen-III C-methyltransferase n=1 Tax=Epibacterium ulvae TaxID=1156985 RepID=UPI0024905022|nr:uroporphyrinogen-III C-methyltransferase [Epibacterium ulvae]
MKMIPDLETLLPAVASGKVGKISLVGAGPGAADLLTLRALRVLQAADVIYFDRLIDPEVLELANPKAAQVFVGKDVGACAWPQEVINQMIVEAAKAGQHVVRLKSGDPSVFGRADEERAAAAEAGVTCDVIPGITAASAAAAVLGQSLTSRGESDRVIFATGTCRDGDEAPDVAALLRPGTTVALYMATRMSGALQAQLLGAGFRPDMPVEVVASASKPNEAVLCSTLAKLSEDMQEGGISHPAIIFLRSPKHAGADQMNIGANSLITGQAEH